MKKMVLLFFVFLLLLAVVAMQNKKSEVLKTNYDKEVIDRPLMPLSPSEVKTSLFVPYWSVVNTSAIDDQYEALLYFGIAANEKGIDKEEPGYKNIDTFLPRTNKQEKLLIVRMLDAKINSSALSNKTVRDAILHDSVHIAKEKGFDGVVLDFEYSALAFDSVTKSITRFYQEFGRYIKANNLSFHITIYGDTFYRSRPYDIGEISKDVDTVFIMAYDFHKARQNPGPNFPLNGKAQYGYEMEMLVTDFAKHVPKEKIAVVFGMFGYDWTVDSKGLGVGTARAMSTNEIENTFLHGCAFKNCIIKRDPTSSETSIRYLDTEDKQHEVWFEDKTSVEMKKKYLNEQGITNFSFWAHSYF